jgi:2-phospho-L-lactate/phosphoenolpyruvate guanylyltransferase
MRTVAILPVKRFAAAKSRLGESVAEELRARLARAMVADVLQALARTAAVEITIVVTREPSLTETADEHGAVLVQDTAEDGQSAAVALGVERALAAGFGRVLCIPGDCPALDPAELDALLSVHANTEREPPAGAEAKIAGARGGSGDPAAGGRSVVIVPDRHGTGTNGLLLTPPDAIAPAFGPGSCERHRALALKAGVECRVARPPSLLLDIDTGADLAALRDRLAGADAPAIRTRAVLAQPASHPEILINNAG